MKNLEVIVNKNNKLPKNQRVSRRQVTRIMGVSPDTIGRELRRGGVIVRDTHWREVISYSAMKAQDDHDRKASAKGPKLKMGNNHELVRKMENYIVKEKYSPYATIERLKDDHDYQKTPICERTLYNYIDRNLLLNVTKKDLPRKGKRRKMRSKIQRQKPFDN